MKIKKWSQFINESLVDYHEEFDIQYSGHNSHNIELEYVIIEVDDYEYSFEVHNTEGEFYSIKPIHEEEGTTEFDEYIKSITDEKGSLMDGELKEFLSVDNEDCIHEYEQIDGFDITIIDFMNQGGYEEGFISVEINGEEIGVSFIEDATNHPTVVRDIYVEDGEDILDKHNIDVEDFFHSVLHGIYQNESRI